MVWLLKLNTALFCKTITDAANAQTIVHQIYLSNGISAILTTANLTKCTTVKVIVLTTSEIMLLVIILFVWLIIVKLLRKMENVKLVSSHIMLSIVFASIKGHVLNTTQQQANVDYVETVTI